MVKPVRSMYYNLSQKMRERSEELGTETLRQSFCDDQMQEHKMEHVNCIRGVQFINDSRSTNINSTWYTLEQMERPVILLMGGVHKGCNYQMIYYLVKEKVKSIIAIGRENEKIIDAFGVLMEGIVETTDMREAVYIAFRNAKRGDVILLSPACASFDVYENYEHRGRVFKKEVALI